VQGFYDDLKGIKSGLRNALLVSKRNIDSKNATNREELFRSTAVSDEKAVSGEKTAEDALMTANNDITEALRRTINLMQGELERSVLSTQMLDVSTTTLRSTSNTYDALDNILTTSKQLVTALEKADRIDRLLIMAGLVFFFLVVLFILKQRVIDRGIRIALFWTRFIPRKAKTIEGILERGDIKVVSTVTSVATSATTLATSVLSSFSIVSLVGSTSSSPLSGTETLPSVEPAETVTSIIVDEPLVTYVHEVPRDEL